MITPEALALKITSAPLGTYDEEKVQLAQCIHKYTIRLMKWAEAYGQLEKELYDKGHRA